MKPSLGTRRGAGEVPEGEQNTALPSGSALPGRLMAKVGIRATAGAAEGIERFLPKNTVGVSFP